MPRDASLIYGNAPMCVEGLWMARLAFALGTDRGFMPSLLQFEGNRILTCAYISAEPRQEWPVPRTRRRIFHHGSAPTYESSRLISPPTTLAKEAHPKPAKESQVAASCSGWKCRVTQSHPAAVKSRTSSNNSCRR